MSSEQRRHPRTELMEATIYFSEERRGQASGRTHYSGTLLNISKGGVGMRVSHPHPINELLWLEGLEGINRPQPGGVKWIKECGAEEFELGIEFYF